MSQVQAIARPANLWLTAKVWRSPDRPWEFCLRPVDSELVEALAPFCGVERSPDDQVPRPTLRLGAGDLEELVDFRDVPLSNGHSKNSFLDIGTIITVTCPWDNCCALAGEMAYALLVDVDSGPDLSLVL
jgi:hypothetical protein